MGKVIISADSTCDIGPELQKRYNVQLINWRILLDGKEYMDNVTIFPDDLYRAWRERGILPKSTGATSEEYKRHFKPLVEQATRWFTSASDPVFPAPIKMRSRRQRKSDM